MIKVTVILTVDNDLKPGKYLLETEVVDVTEYPPFLQVNCVNPTPLKEKK